jgi:hypothetical protein
VGRWDLCGEELLCYAHKSQTQSYDNNNNRNIMLHRTLPLQTRVGKRLRGFRSPSVRILRKAIAGIDKAALVEPLTVPHVEPPSGLSFATAWKNLNVPLASIIEHQQALNSKWQSMNGPQEVNDAPATLGMCKS